MARPKLSLKIRASAACSNQTAIGTPSNPPTTNTELCFQRILFLNAQRFAACTVMLQAIISGIASSGGGDGRGKRSGHARTVENSEAGEEEDPNTVEQK